MLGGLDLWMLDSRLTPWLLQVAGLLLGWLAGWPSHWACRAAGLAGFVGRRAWLAWHDSKRRLAAPLETFARFQAGFLVSEDVHRISENS